MRNSKCKYLMSIIIISSFGCKSSFLGSDLDFAMFGGGIVGLVSVADNSTVNICTNDSSRANDVKTAVAMWFAALGKKPEINVSNGNGCDATVTFAANGESPSYAQVSNQPSIHMNTGSSWYNSNNVLLHEFGHAFGLKDRYQGRGGSCVEPQPTIMCMPQYGKLQQDDIDGVREVYRVAKGGALGDAISTEGFGNNGGGGGNDGQGTVSPLDAAIQRIIDQLNNSGTNNNVITNPTIELTICPQNIQGRLVDDPPTKSKVVLLTGSLFGHSVTACVGDKDFCSNPHAERYLTNSILLQNGQKGFVSPPLAEYSLQGLRAKSHQENKSLFPLMTIDGITASATPGATEVPFRCEISVNPYN